MNKLTNRQWQAMFVFLAILYLSHGSSLAQTNNITSRSVPETCAEALPVGLGEYNIGSINSGNSASNICTFPISGNATHARWYIFTPAVSGSYTISSAAHTSVDTRLSVHTGSCGDLTCFVSNDDVGAGSFASEVTADFDAGTTYYIEWDNRWSSLGFNWSIIFNCISPVTGSEIAGNQTVCFNAVPSPFTSVSLPAGHSGKLEYQWQISTTSPTFVDIAGAASETYTHAGTITQATWFRRLARVDCATDWSGAVASNVVKVETEALVFITNTIVSLNPPSAFAGGDIDNPCEASNPVTERGVCWSTSENPEHGSATCVADTQAGAGSFDNLELTGLVSPKTYYLRAYAITSQGTFYGQQVTFNTGAYNAKDPDTPFLSIQDAIDASVPGDVIRIPGGEYPGNVSTTFAGGVTLYPGDSPTCVTITGTFTVTNGDELVIDIEGSDVCTEYTQLTIQGAIDLAGIELVVQLDYLPAVGHSYVIIDNQSGSAISGQFDQGTSFVEFYDVYQITFDIEYDHDTDNVRLVVTSITDLSAIPIGNPALYLSILLIAGFIVFRRFIKR